MMTLVEASLTALSIGCLVGWLARVQVEAWQRAIADRRAAIDELEELLERQAEERELMAHANERAKQTGRCYDMPILDRVRRDASDLTLALAMLHHPKERTP